MRSFAPSTLPASYGRYVAPLPASAQLTLDLALPGRNEAEIDGLIAAQNNPGSRYYRHYLTPGQYGRYFGADPAALARAVASLRVHGFTIDRILANRRDLIVHAPASAVEAAFDTPIDLRTDGTRTFYAARYAPRLREDLARRERQRARDVPPHARSPARESAHPRRRASTRGDRRTFNLSTT